MILAPGQSARLRRGVGVTLAAITASQVAAAAALMAVDAVRKRRQPPTGEFPRATPARLHAVGSDLTLYTDGEQLFDAMLADIRAARERIFFETYIWKGDAVGELFKEELTAAARRGVKVHIIYDTFGNLVVPASFKEFDPALEVLPFPLASSAVPVSPRNLGRDHRKLMVVDGRVGYVGGYNIGKHYADSWRDTHMRIDGPAVWELANAFTDFWNDYRKKHHSVLPDQGARSWDARIRAVLNLPDRLLFPMRGLYMDAIDRAVDSIAITQAYFLPDEAMINGLLKAVDRGVHVRILVPEFSNHVVADWAARAHYDRLLAGGVHIYLFQHAMVHAKTATVDGRWSTIGTTNIDRLSLTGNFEINLEINDEGVAATMERVFATDLSNSRELTREEWAARPLWKRPVERLIAPLSLFL